MVQLLFSVGPTCMLLCVGEQQRVDKARVQLRAIVPIGLRPALCRAH
jgi:hypothetical protein